MVKDSLDLIGLKTTVIHQNKTPAPRSKLLEKGSNFDFMLFLGDFSGPSRLGFSK